MTVSKVLAEFGLAAMVLLVAQQTLAPFFQQAAPSAKDGLGPMQVFNRTPDGFMEAQNPSDSVVPRDHAILYCSGPQKKFFTSNMRVDRDADGSVSVLQDRNIPDPAQRYTRQTLPRSDFRLLPVNLDTKRKLGQQIQEICQDMTAHVPAGRKVARLAETLGF